MGTCKMCGLKYSLLEARGDGLCPICAKKDDKQKELKQLEDAKTRLKEIVANIAPDDEIGIFGVARWETIGAKLSSKFYLWVGRFLFGILGDIFHSKIQVLGVIGLSSQGFLYIGKIGEISENSVIDPDSIIRSKLIVKSVSKTLIGEVSTLHYSDTLEVEIRGKKALCATFPKCFITDNELIPKKISSILDERQKAEAAKNEGAVKKITKTENEENERKKEEIEKREKAFWEERKKQANDDFLKY